MHEDDAVFGYEVDHIISEKHGGATAAENLAYACAFCNRAKAVIFGSIVQGIKTSRTAFNPRIDRWAEHFTLDGVTIVAPLRHWGSHRPHLGLQQQRPVVGAAGLVGRQASILVRRRWRAWRVAPNETAKSGGPRQSRSPEHRRLLRLPSVAWLPPSWRPAGAGRGQGPLCRLRPPPDLAAPP